MRRPGTVWYTGAMPGIKRTDIIASLIIGEAAALLMLAIGRALALPAGLSSLLPWLPVLFPLFTLAIMMISSVIGRRVPVAYQFSKFLLVGGLNFLIDLAVLNALIALSGVSQGALAVGFKGASFVVAVISSFFWNKFWTFRAASLEHAGGEFVQFLTVSVIGLLTNAGAFSLLNDALGPRSGIRPQAWASIAAGGAAVVGLLWNFLGYKFFVFRRPQR